MKTKTPRTDAAHKTEDIQTIYEVSQELERENHKLREEMNRVELVWVKNCQVAMDERQQWKACSTALHKALKNSIAPMMQHLLAERREVFAAFDNLNAGVGE